MRGLLVLYLVQSASPGPDATGFVNPGRGWSRADASILYGWYTGLAYLLPIVGGWLADRVLGTHRSMVVGGLVIALGHTVLAVSGLGSLGTSELGMTIFVFGLALIVVGTGHFKPCVSVMVGQLYGPGDPRRDGAFTIFYMGINLGAFLSAFICGTLGERVGWHWGFGAAAIGMLAGLGLYLATRERLLPGIGDPPPGTPDRSLVVAGVGIVVAALAAGAYGAGLLSVLGTLLARRWIPALLAVAVLAAVARFVARLPPTERGPTITILVFMLFNAVFWLAFEQAGSSLNLFTDTRTDRTIAGFAVPTTWFQSINAGLIFILAPLFAGVWSWVGPGPSAPRPGVTVAIATRARR
jgi:POT family proton-dependent oligopeptide transporter